MTTEEDVNLRFTIKADAPGAFLGAEVQFAKSWVFSKFGLKFYWERLPGAGFFSIKIKM